MLKLLLFCLNTLGRTDVGVFNMRDSSPPWKRKKQLSELENLMQQTDPKLLRNKYLVTYTDLFLERSYYSPKV